MKREGKFRINFSNRLLYTLIIIGILIAVGVGVYASTYANTAGVGHDFTELKPCSGTEILKMNGAGAWTCQSDATGIPSETDPQVGAVTANRWCIGDGSAVQCNQNAPASTVLLGSMNGYCTRSESILGNFCDRYRNYEPAYCGGGGMCACRSGYVAVVTGFWTPLGTTFRYFSCIKT